MSAARRFLVLWTLRDPPWITMAIVAYDQLPASIPMHFGPSGAADSYAVRSIATWYALPAIGVCTTLLMVGLAQITHRRPDLYNVPGKAEMLGLPAERQRPFLEQLAMFMTLLATSVLLLFMAIHYDTWRVAMGDQRGLSWSPSAMFLCGGMVIAVPLWLLRFKRGDRPPPA
jgi:hypothetical protein